MAPVVEEKKAEASAAVEQKKSEIVSAVEEKKAEAQAATEKKQPGFDAIFAVCGLLAVAGFTLNKKN